MRRRLREAQARAGVEPEAQEEHLELGAAPRDDLARQERKGREGDPAWYRNIQADPNVTTIYKRFQRPYRARIAAGEERLRYLRATDDATYGVYAAYARKTSREIPVVILEPAAK